MGAARAGNLVRADSAVRAPQEPVAASAGPSCRAFKSSLAKGLLKSEEGGLAAFGSVAECDLAASAGGDLGFSPAELGAAFSCGCGLLPRLLRGSGLIITLMPLPNCLGGASG